MQGHVNEAYDENNKSTPIGIKLSIIQNRDDNLSIPFGSAEFGTKDYPLEEEKPSKESFSQKYKKELQIGIQSLIHITVGVYFGFAIYFYSVVVQERDEADRDKFPQDERCYIKCPMQFCTGFGMLTLIIGLTYFGLFYYLLFKPNLGRRFHRSVMKPFGQWWYEFSRRKLVSLALICGILALLVVFLFFEMKDKPQKVAGITAPCFFILAGFVFSTSRKHIPWRMVITGILCQFILAVICIRWEVGRDIFKCLGDKIATFLNYSKDGARFVFSDLLVDEGVFAFAILPVIFFFSFFISILYYLGTMQWVVLKLGWVLQQILGTTVCESVTAAANIFLGMTESPLLIRPYIKLLTASEIHSIMVSGFATVSGTVLAAYMSFGASPAHLITSSVMAAPATLAISKLYMPETEESKTTTQNMQLEKSEDTSILDAASNGASQAIPIILGIIANIVAFVAFISFLNAVVNWFCYFLGWYGIDFEWIFSKIFIPLAWSMGVPWHDCDIVAKVVATKTIVNEFVAYERLGYYIDNKQLDARSAGIATFAICGFANPSSLGILIGSLGALAPTRRNLIASVALRAFVVGSIVCFVSASFAGILIPEEETQRQYKEFFEARALAKNHTMIAGILPL